jgi:hypothetical protein
MRPDPAPRLALERRIDLRILSVAEGQKPAPDLAIGGFSLRILGREFPDNWDYWDGNWLAAQARMEAPGVLVEVAGPIVHLSELVRFAEALARLDSTLVGEAALTCMEPGIGLSLTATHLGHVEVRISITPDHLTQRHEFELVLDQTWLAPLLESLEELLARFPVRGFPGD